MEKLTEKKRQWIIQQFRAGKSASIIAEIQHISRQWVYALAKQFKMEGIGAYAPKKAGRPPSELNKAFVKKVVALRNRDDYGSTKLHYVLRKEGFTVSQRQIQKILDVENLTDPCEKRRGQRTYVRYQWPISNYFWHVDWSEYEDKQYCAFIDDRSRNVMAAGEFINATTDNTKFVLYQAILTNQVCPVILLSDKGAQFYANKYGNKGKKGTSFFEKELDELGIEFWTSRRNHPQTNGKMEKWFDTLKRRKKRHPNETLQEFVLWYNTKRIHHALGYSTPADVYREKL